MTFFSKAFNNLPIQIVERSKNADKIASKTRCEAGKMDIKNLTNNVSAGRNSDAVKPQEKSADNSSSSTSSATVSDRVTLTDVLSQVRELESKSQEVKIDNAERIAAIKAAINDGSYQVDAQRIAEKLIQTEALFAKG